MSNLELMRQLAMPTGGKIILLVMDGLGDMPMQPGGLSALEAANTPNLDQMAADGCLGLSYPIARGVTPGSGPAHLALFGYDPVTNPVGRGVLSAFGAGLEFRAGDVAARGNFCSVDADGVLTDRRAGRISDAVAAPLVAKLQTIKVEGAEVTVRPEKEYRFVVSFRGEGLSGALHDTDPQVTGKRTLPVQPLTEEATKTAQIVQSWLDQVAVVLKDDHPANMVTLRGFGEDPGYMKFTDLYKMKAACVAVYPMYKGVAGMVGMDVLPTADKMNSAEQLQVVADHWNEYDFFFIHIKYTDSRGEDGNWEGKKQVIESVDAAMPILLGLNPSVIVVSGDHSTPAKLKGHSWHPVPTLLWAPATHLTDLAQSFGEREATKGGLGHFQAAEIMPMALGHALRLQKYGA